MAQSYLTPLSELRDQVNRIFSDFSEESRMPTLMGVQAGWMPSIEVSETDKDVVVCASLPGMKPEDINVEVVGNSLVLSGEYHREQKQDEKQVHRSEFQYGSFMRRITLPDYVKSDGADAHFKDGILELHLPKAEEMHRKRIEVKSEKSGQQQSGKSGK